ncbi:ribokinase [Brevibacillus laterosporus]|uniref:Ribokinase n=1 Tax=Brevibacillus laterosporus TaxID=1465 RepID=A0A502HZW5_BRELA|nr:ribokinase [Brevibacillus laterosporus]QDX91238.1 ribokinase [Brevibacillus laterosporus]TPG69639.1 ribokinase [Brevibacillus laterosporus]TPG79485.1 ribokinase [Brevibacillus laterosporus]
MRQPRVAVIGSLNMDVVVEAPRQPKMGETISGDNVHFIPGGKGANQAVAAARLGAQTSMIGSLGRDAFGDSLDKAMQQEGIQVNTIKHVENVPTGIASILLAEGDNQIIVVAGANAHTSPADVDLHADTVKAADIVLLQLEIPIETVVYAAKLAKEAGKMVILNPAPAQQLPDELFGYVDVMTPNESELYLLTETAHEGAKADQVATLPVAMKALHAKGVKHVITTLGSIGSAYLMDGETFGTIASHKVQVVDTTGAGDSYNAGLAYALASGQTIPEAVAFASVVSALAVTKLGAQNGMPTMKDVLAFQSK